MKNAGDKSIEKLSDEKLVELCREDKVSAADELIRRFAPSVFKRAASYSASLSEDLAQEGFLALLDAVRSYSPDRGASFSTFAQLCIRNRMINVCKRVLNDCDELSEDLDRPDDPAGIPENIVVQQSSVDELYSMLNSELSKLELKVLRYYVAGLPYSEIADKLGVTKKTVDNAVQRMRKKVRDLLG